MILFQNKEFYIESHESEIPWLKIFTQTEYKELTHMPHSLRNEMWEICYIIEECMIEHYNPTKINIASFANMLPRVHIHIMARFEDDNYFPNPMWGERVRDSDFSVALDNEFTKKLQKSLEHFYS